MVGLSLMIFISTKTGNPPPALPCAHTLPFGAPGSTVIHRGNKITARDNGCGRAPQKAGGRAPCSCADAAASNSKY